MYYSLARVFNTVLAIAIIGISVDASALGIQLPGFAAKTDSDSSSSERSSSTPREPAATPAPTPPPGSSAAFKALWNGQHADANKWSGYVRDAVDEYADALLKGPKDVALFCPMYDRLGTQDRLNFWVQLIAAMTKYESGFRPHMRYTESTMGTDPVTGVQVVSEGLLQLSYQDERNYGGVLPSGTCDFNFAVDKKYAKTDVRRTILDPKTNLRCGIAILNRQIERYGKIGISTGAYWSVLKTTSTSGKLALIKKITNDLSFCKK